MNSKFVKIAKLLYQKGYYSQSRMLITAEYNLGSIYNLPTFDIYPPQPNFYSPYDYRLKTIEDYKKINVGDQIDFTASDQLMPRDLPGSDMKGLFEQKEYFKSTREFREYHDRYKNKGKFKGV